MIYWILKIICFQPSKGKFRSLPPAPSRAPPGLSLESPPARFPLGSQEAEMPQWRVYPGRLTSLPGVRRRVGWAFGGLFGDRDGYGQRFLPALLCRAQGQVWTRVSGIWVSAGRWAEKRPRQRSAVLSTGKRRGEAAEELGWVGAPPRARECAVGPRSLRKIGSVHWLCE